MGINKAGDVQSLYMPATVPKAFADEVDALAIIGNLFDVHSKQSFIFTNASDIGLVFVIETFPNVPDEIRPKESLPAKFLVDTA
jgi:hypothetical protein